MIYRYVCCLFIEIVCLTALSVLIMGSLHTKPPPYDFFIFVWGLPAGTEGPRIQVLDILPHYG
jgi:hypothetical protein